MLAIMMNDKKKNKSLYETEGGKVDEENNSQSGLFKDSYITKTSSCIILCEEGGVTPVIGFN